MMNSIEEAKEVLRKAGYYVDNLWHVDDVRNNDYWLNGGDLEEDEFKSDLTDEECFEILDSALTSEYAIEAINDWIADEL